MTKTKKNYTIGLEQASKLARKALDLSEKTNKTIYRQEVLNALVDCLDDKAVYNKVLSKLK